MPAATRNLSRPALCALLWLWSLQAMAQTPAAALAATPPAAEPAAAPASAASAAPSTPLAAPAAPDAAEASAPAAAPSIAPVAAPPAAPVDPSQLSAVERHAQKAGFHQCAPALTQITQRALSSSTTHQAMTTVGDREPDRHALQALLVAEQGQGEPEIFSLSVSPNAAGGCDASYTAMRYHDSSCAAMRETVAQGFKYVDDLGNYATYVRGTREYLTLFPLPKGCLAVRSEAVY